MAFLCSLFNIYVLFLIIADEKMNIDSLGVGNMRFTLQIGRMNFFHIFFIGVFQKRI